MENTYQNHTEILQPEQTNANTGLAATGGIIAGIGASACCLLPLLLTMAGISGAWMANLRAMTIFKPYFIAMSVIALGYGFYQVYWKSPKDCAQGQACARPLPNRMVKLGLWSGAVIILSVLSFPYWFPVILPYLP